MIVVCDTVDLSFTELCMMVKQGFLMFAQR